MNNPDKTRQHRTWLGRSLARLRGGRGSAEARPPAPDARGGGAGETAWARGMFFGQVPLERWNPDDLLARHGHAIYRRMLRDDQIRALMALRQAMLTSRPWRFAHTGRPNGTHARCAEFFTHVLRHQLQGTFSQALGALLSSQAHGFSLLEKVYQPVRWRGRWLWGVSALKQRPPETFTFESDAHGNLMRLVQQQGARPVPLDRARFIHHVNKPEAHPFYGESDLRECHRHWWAKDNILKFWNIYLERMAAGFVHGRVSGPLSTAERDELRQVLQNLGAQTAIITPASVELEMVMAPSTDAFERAVAARDKAIAKALLVPNLLGFSEQGRTGSYAQSRTQHEAFVQVLGAQAESVADTLNEQLFRELAWWNFGLTDPPRFSFDPLTDSQRRDLAQGWARAVGAGVVTPQPADEQRLRALLDFPAGPPANHTQEQP